MSKLVVEIKGELTEGSILIVKDGCLVPVFIKELLPELKKIKDLFDEVTTLDEKVTDLSNKVKELRGED